MHGNQFFGLSILLRMHGVHSTELVVEMYFKLWDGKQWRGLYKDSKFRPSNDDLSSGHVLKPVSEAEHSSSNARRAQHKARDRNVIQALGW